MSPESNSRSYGSTNRRPSDTDDNADDNDVEQHILFDQSRYPQTELKLMDRIVSKTNREFRNKVNVVSLAFLFLNSSCNSFYCCVSLFLS